MNGIVWEFERTVGVPTVAARAEVLRALNSLSFNVTDRQFSVLEATRGNQWGGALQQEKLPLAVKVHFGTGNGGCSFTARFEERLAVPGQLAARLVRRQYKEVFTKTLQCIDRCLESVDPTFRPGFPPARVLEAGGDRDDTRIDALAGVDEVRFHAPGGSVALNAVQTAAHLSVGQLVMSQSDAMPAHLVAQIEHLVIKVENTLESQRRAVIEIDIIAEEQPVFEFLHQQASIRSSLPLRTLHVCKACRFEKIENPDYQRILQQNARVQQWGTFTKVIADGAVSPFELASLAVRAKTVQPSFVCGRCQGLEVTSSVMTLCPSCGARHQSAVLTTCAPCGHDFRSSLAREQVWGALPPPLAIAASPLPRIGSPAMAPPQPLQQVAPPAGWYPDIAQRHELRYWDGGAWTEHVVDKGRPNVDPLE